MGTWRWIGALLFVVAGAGLASCGGGAGNPDGIEDTLLASYALGEGQSSQPGLVLSVVMIVGHQDFPGPPAPPVIAQVDVSPPLPAGAAPGRYEFRPGENAALDVFLTRLVDGTDDTVGGGWRVGTGFGFASDLESIKLENRADWLSGPDLVGATITRLVVDVSHVGPDPLNAAIFTARATVSFFGTP